MLIEEVWQLNKDLVKMNELVPDFKKLPYYTIKDIRDLVMAYIQKNELDRGGGQVTLDPLTVRLLDNIPKAGTESVRKDALFKNL